MSVAPREVLSALEEAEALLLSRLGPHGVIRIEWLVGFVEPFTVSVWLGTATDAERDVLSAASPALADVRELIERGLPPFLARFHSTVCQSQETVDRDFRGSWFYALR